MQFLSRIYIKNGVTRGGCLAFSYFRVYLNKLIETLRTSNVGCRYHSQYMVVYCYSDDLNLLSTSFTRLQEMLRLCELYAIDHNIIFKVKKSQLLYFGSNPLYDL